MTTSTASCKSCGAPIVWASTSAGGVMPVDRDRVAGGNIVLVERDALSTPRAEIVAPDPDVPRHVSHFATCPNADRHRRR